MNDGADKRKTPAEAKQPGRGSGTTSNNRVGSNSASIVLPRNEIAETQLLANLIMFKGAAYAHTSVNLRKELFTKPSYRNIFDCIYEMPDEDSIVNRLLPSLSRKLISDKDAVQLCDVIVSVGLIDTYAKELEETYCKREQLIYAQKLIEGLIDAQEKQKFANLLQNLDPETGRSVGGTAIFADLQPYLVDNPEVESPTVAAVLDGKSLFYAGRLNEVHGEPGVGKTNVILASCISVLRAGGLVVYIDPEDTPAGIVGRLRLLGASVEQIARSFNYLHDPSPDEIRGAQRWAERQKPVFVAVDGLAELLAAGGYKEDLAGDVLAFFRTSLRPFADGGAAVVIADHVTKSTEGRGRYARGSGAKLGRYDGASYEVREGQPYTPSTPGFIKMIVSKDRTGGLGVPHGEVMAELHFSPLENGCTLAEFKSPSGEWLPTILMKKILEAVGANGPQCVTELRGLGNHDTVALALRELVRRGDLVCSTEGRKKMYSLPGALPV